MRIFPYAAIKFMAYDKFHIVSRTREILRLDVALSS